MLGLEASGDDLGFTDTMIYDSFVEGYSFDAHFGIGFGFGRHRVLERV